MGKHLGEQFGEHRLVLWACAGRDAHSL